MKNTKLPPSLRRARREAGAMFGRVTWMAVALGRHFEKSDEEITQDVNEGFKEAFAPYRPLMKTIEIDGKQEECVQTPGLFRMVINEFDLEKADRFEQDVWKKFVDRSLADALAHEGPFDTASFAPSATPSI